MNMSDVGRDGSNTIARMDWAPLSIARRFSGINILKIVDAGVYLSVVFWIYFGREDSTQRSR